MQFTIAIQFQFNMQFHMQFVPLFAVYASVPTAVCPWRLCAFAVECPLCVFDVWDAPKQIPTAMLT